MKKNIFKTIAVLVISFALLSFSKDFGGEGFEIYVNGKVVLQQFGNEMNSVKSLQLNQNSPNDKITVRYYHCGRVGNNRTITVKDDENKVIKVWSYEDSKELPGSMSCTVQDILSLTKGSNKVLKIYYASSQLPAGRMLTKLSFSNNTVAAKK